MTTHSQATPPTNNNTPESHGCAILLNPSKLDYGAVDYQQIKTADFLPAFKEAFDRSYQRAGALKAQMAQDDFQNTFANTIEPIEAIDLPLEQVMNTFLNLVALRTSAELNKLAEIIKPKKTELSNHIFMETVFFERVNELYEKRDQLALNAEQAALLRRTYIDFIRNGAKLNAAEKKRVAEIDSRVAMLGEQFRANLTAAMDNSVLFVTDPAELVGIKENALNAARELATKKGNPDAWAFSLQLPSVSAILSYAKNRALRETIWKAYNSRNNGGEYDNRLLCLEIAQLLAERAKILGFNTYAEYMATDRMAQNAQNIRSFLKKLAETYLPAAKKDLAEVEKLAGHKLEPWDFAYYSEQLRTEKYSYDQEELSHYFPIDQVMEGALFAAEQRYGIKFIKRDLPTWHESVSAYEVQENGKTIALFYLDPFPRTGKTQGAFMEHLQRARLENGQWIMPHVVNAGNFTPPTKNEDGSITPALLKLTEVTTVFHELGHGLHGILTNVGYRTLSGANTAYDAVELPSQINESWVLQPEVLKVYAKHYKTGEPLSEAVADRVRQAEQFLAGWLGLRQVSFGMLDMAWFDKPLSELQKMKTADDVIAFENAELAPYRLFTLPPDAAMSPAFKHIFGGEYAAGYYGYKWADVLAADAFSVFEKNGVFDRETSERFRTHILAPGRTEEPQVLYRRFKGGDPDPDALLRREGLLK